jgi:predicted nucleic acid-binding protein
MIVVDASIVVELLLNKPASDDIWRRLMLDRHGLAAPHLLDVEVAQVLRRHNAGGELNDARARDALQTLADFPARRYAHAELLDRIWQLRHNLTAYDAAYIALAEALDATLLTRDARLAAATPDRHTLIEVL